MTTTLQQCDVADCTPPDARDPHTCYQCQRDEQTRIDHDRKQVLDHVRWNYDDNTIELHDICVQCESLLVECTCFCEECGRPLTSLQVMLDEDTCDECNACDCGSGEHWENCDCCGESVVAQSNKTSIAGIVGNGFE